MGGRTDATTSEGTTYLIRGPFRPASDAVSRSVLELAIAMQESGRDVRVVSWTDADPFGELSKMAPKTIVRLGPESVGGRYTSRDRIAFIWKVFRYLSKNVRTGDYVVTLEDPTALGLAVLSLRMRAIKHYIYVMDLQSIQHLALDHGGRKALILNKVRRGLDRLTWRFCDAVVVLGDCMREVITEAEPGAKVIVLPIWQDGVRIHPVEATATRQALGIDDKLVVMYHGHATYRQPLGILLDAADELGDDPNVLFMVVGNGPSVDWLERSAAERGLSNIRVTPRVEQANFLDVLASADVHVAVLDERATGTCVPSKTYTAMAVAKPCLYVGAKTGQAALDLTSAESGYVLGTDESDLFVQHVRDLGGDAKERERLGEQGRAYFMRERELSVITKRWLELLS